MTLSPDQLNEMDRFVLDFLATHEWAPPNIIRIRYNEATGKDVSSQWVSSRVRDLAKHDHLERIHPDTALYRLKDDPRPDTDPDYDQKNTDR